MKLLPSLRAMVLGVALLAASVAVIMVIAGPTSGVVVSSSISISALIAASVVGEGRWARAYRRSVRAGFQSRCKVCGVKVPRGDAVCSPEHLEEYEARTAW